MRDDSVLSVDGEVLVEALHEHLPDQAPFVNRMRDGFHPVDVLVIVAVPVVLVGAFQLPLETRRALAFRYAAPSVGTAFTANYVHLSVPHLLSNVVAYIAITLAAFLLALSNGHRRRFLAVLGGVLLLVPIPLVYLNLAVPRPGATLGFSGLNMALFGFVLVEFAAYANEYFTDDFGVENAPAFFFLVTAFVAAPHAESLTGLLVVASSLGLALVYSLGFLLTYRPSIAGVGAAFGKQGYFELLLVTGLLLVAFVPAAFPHDPVTDAGVVNVYGHLVGFCIGFVAVYGWVLLATPADPKKALPVPA